ncbi:MAG: alpha-L-fucosidase [Armatimonadota bacterium]
MLDSLLRTPEDAMHEASLITPSPRQLAWQEMEFIGFAHFTVNTFTGREWGKGTEPESIFNPVQLDARQWIRACKDAGMRMLILTAKHHDGFCLWPSKLTEHSVKNSPWRDGKGDVVREVSEACREFGLKFGIYCSPWDRNAACYGTPAYNDFFKGQLRELLTQYGEIGEVWLDGACGEGPNGKRQVYDWQGYVQLIRELQPNAVIGPSGPDVRWVGNEDGFARETEWSVVGIDFDGVPADDYNTSFYNTFLYDDGKSIAHETSPGHIDVLTRSQHLVWWPAETDVSLRPGWFYHAEEDFKVHSLERLVDIYYKSVGRNSVLLLNITPDRRGLIPDHDVQRLRELRAVIDATFADNLALCGKVTADTTAHGHTASTITDGNPETYWMAGDGLTTAVLEIDLGNPRTFNRALLQEMITTGQRVISYVLEGRDGEQWKEITRGATIGYKKLARFSEITTDRLRLTLTARATPTLRSVGLYRAALGG